MYEIVVYSIIGEEGTGRYGFCSCSKSRRLT